MTGHSDRLRPNLVRLGEALYRSEAHCAVACELYGAGRPADAVLHSVRPITDTFPWLETELRSRPDQLRDLMVAVSTLSGAMRHAARPRVARRHLKAVTAARRNALDVVVGRAADSATFRASVGIALLETMSARYEEGVPRGDLNEYQTAYALIRIARELVEPAMSRADRRSSEALTSVAPTLDPPSRLIRPDEVRVMVSTLASAVAESVEIVRAGRSVDNELERVEALLADVVRSYEEDVPALAGRLAASLYVRAYDPLRDALREVDAAREERLADTLGVDLRRAINAAVTASDVVALADTARTLIRELREGALSSRDDAAFESARGTTLSGS